MVQLYKLLSISQMLPAYDLNMTICCLCYKALDSFKAESEFELTLSAGDIVIVRKVTYAFITIVSFLHVVNIVFAFFLKKMQS